MSTFIHLYSFIEGFSNVYVQVSETQANAFMDYYGTYKDLDIVKLSSLNGGDPEYTLAAIEAEVTEAAPKGYQKDGILYYKNSTDLYESLIRYSIFSLAEYINNDFISVSIKEKASKLNLYYNKVEPILKQSLDLPTSYTFDNKELELSQGTLIPLLEVPDILDPKWIDILAFLANLPILLQTLEQTKNKELDDLSPDLFNKLTANPEVFELQTSFFIVFE